MTAVELNFAAVAPLLTLAVAALVVLVLELVLPDEKARGWCFTAGVGGVFLSLYYTALLWSMGEETIVVFGSAYALDRFALIFTSIVLIAAFGAILLSTLRALQERAGYIALVLSAALGMSVVAGAGNMITLFLGLELLSLSLYVAVAFGRHKAKAKEAAFKYLVLGSVASGFMLYGFALLYGQTGAVDLASLLTGWTGEGDTLMKVGTGLVMLGLAFKMALVPFHMWAPDVYEGAPAPITAFMSVGTKAAAFAALVRFLAAVLPQDGASLMMPLWILAILSMIIGSLGAAVQTNVKRLLAFSGVTHAGYLMLALVGLRSEGIQAGAFYMAAYLFMNLGVFAIVVWLTKDGREGETLSDFAGLFYRRPVLAISMTLFLLSLAGFPPAGGFPGKIFLIFSALASGVGNIAGWLVGTLVATTGISAYAYLKVVATMFRRGETAGVPTGIVGVAEAATTAEAGVSSYGEEARVLDELEPEDDLEGENEEPAEEVDFSWAYAIVVAVAVLGTLYLGILPNSALVLAEQLLPLP